MLREQLNTLRLSRPRCPLHIPLAFFVLVVLNGCGGGGDGGSTGTSTPVAQPASNAYFPMNTGDLWLYEVNSQSGSSSPAPSLFQVAVGATANVGGAARTTLLTTELDGTVLDDTAYAATTEGLTAFPASRNDYEQAIGPYYVMQQIEPQVGTSFVQIDKTVDSGVDADGDGARERIIVRSTVEVVDRDPLTVAAGRFAETLHLRTTATETVIYSRSTSRPVYRTVQDDWYAPGVGLVRSSSVETLDGWQLSSTGYSLRAYQVQGRHAGTPARVITITPDNTAVHNGSVAVQATFDTPMSRDTLRNGGMTVLDAGGASIAGSVVLSSDSLTAVFVPTGGWRSGSFTASIGTSATDRYGNGASARSWTFTLDTVAPALAIAEPSNGASDVPTNSVLNYVFSEQVDTASLISAGLPLFNLIDDSTGLAAPAEVSFDSVSTVSIRPRTFWRHDTSYTLTFPAGTSDLLGNVAGSPISVRFSTPKGVFRREIDLGLGNGLSRAMLADLNRDGRDDLVWAAWDNSSFPGTMRYYMRAGLAGGGWGSITRPIPDEAYPCAVFSMTHGDINSDGREDLVIGGMCGLQTMIQQSDGSFAAGQRYIPAGFEAGQHARLADLNGDGRIDMINTGNSTAFQVWLQDANGQFNYTATYDGGETRQGDLNLIDLDGDRQLDVVTQGSPKVFWGLGNGSFSAPTSIGTFPPSAVYLAFGDVDGNGHLDVVANSFNAMTGQNLTQVIRQNSPRAFSSPWKAPESNGTMTGLALMDTNGDGRLDAVTGYFDSLSVRLGRSDGTFADEDFYEALPPNGGGATLLESGTADAQGRALLICNGLLFTPSLTVSGSSAIANPATASVRQASRPVSSSASPRVLRPPRALEQSPLSRMGSTR